jgi:DNA-binding transcriptional LysR family regulator
MKRKAIKSFPPVDFDLRQLEVFSKVVELRSFSRAAEAVCLAQASVSERIATLENLVGTRLLDRLGRQIVPTKAGELLYRHALSLLQMKRTACLELEDYLGIKRGEVRVGGSTIPGEYILPKVIGIFRERHPSISVHLTIADSEEIESRVLEGGCELGVVGSRGTRKYLVSRELWKDDLVLAVPARHRWARRKEVSPEEIFEEPFIIREEGSGTLKSIEEHLRTSGIEGTASLRVVAKLGTSTAVKEGIKAGLGVSILSKRALDTEIRTGILKALKVKDLPMVRSFYVLLDKRRSTSPLCKALLDFLLEIAKDNSQALWQPAIGIS